MKRALLTTILGLAASVATTYGQGHVIFNTYVGTVYQPTHFAGGPKNGLIGDGTLQAQLFYGLGAAVPFGSMTAVLAGNGGIAPVNTSSVPGYVIGGDAIIPNYASGPISFAIVLYDGTAWNSPATYVTASPVVWTENSINSTALPTDVFQQNVPALVANFIPEPSSMALIGLGSAAMLILRRRK